MGTSSSALKCVYTGFLLLMQSSITFAQQSFDAFPKGNADAYHLNFSQFFANDGEAQESIERLNRMLGRFISMKGIAAKTAGNLRSLLILQDSIQILFNRIYISYNLRASVNREDVTARNLSDQIDADVSTQSAFFERELSELSAEELTRFIKQEPSIKKYEFYIRDLLRLKSHRISNDLEEQLAQLRPMTSGWQFELYEALDRQAIFGDLESSKGKLNARADRFEIETSPDSAIRAEGFEKLSKGYHDLRSLYAFALTHVVTAEDELAKKHGFTDAAELYYFYKYYSKESINRLLRQIIDSVDVYKYYQQVRVDNLRKYLPYKDIHYWDLRCSPNGFVPRYTADSGTAVIKNALKPLGTLYSTELAELLDPANGRMEIAPGKNKRSGGFSRGFIGTKSVFYSGSYQGYYDDVRRITHESTHAIHRQLMTRNNVLPVYAYGPNYLFESFAIFSEFLLSDYLIEQAPSAEEKSYFLEKYFDGKGMALFSVAQDALLEQSIHEKVISGDVETADDLDSLTASIHNTFSIWPAQEYPQVKQRWITNSLYYEDPFYNVNYVLGSMLALTYYQLYQKDRADFAKRYTELLSNGFNEAPAPLLKHFLDIDINDPAMITGALRVVRSKVKELESLYKK